MTIRFAYLSFFLLVSSALLAAKAKAQPMPAQAPATSPQEAATDQLSETQWLRQRVERLEAELATGNHCPCKKGMPSHAGAAGMKSMQKPPMAAAKMSPMGMEPMDMMGGGMGKMGGMKDAPSKKPMDKMAPGSMQPPQDQPAPAPGGMEHM